MNPDALVPAGGEEKTAPTDPVLDEVFIGAEIDGGTPEGAGRPLSPDR